MQAELRAGKQRIGIRADRVEGDVAEIEQAGEADHDVEAQGEEHVKDGVVRDAHPGCADLREGKGKHG
jgi:hypothetical protein